MISNDPMDFRNQFDKELKAKRENREADSDALLEMMETEGWKVYSEVLRKMIEKLDKQIFDTNTPLPMTHELRIMRKAFVTLLNSPNAFIKKAIQQTAAEMNNLMEA